MKINRIIAAVTAAAVILSFSGCSVSSSSSSSGSSQTSTAEAQTSTSESAGTEQSTAEAEPVKSVLDSGVSEDLVVAKPTNGAEGMEITFGDFLREYRYFLERSGYDNDTDPANAVTISSARQEIIDAIIEDRIVRAKFAEYGMSFTDEEKQSIQSDVDTGVAQIKSSLMQSLAAADETLTEEQLTQQADERFDQILTDCGLTMDALFGWQEVTVMKQKLTNEIGKDATYSYEDAQAQVQRVIDNLKAEYESDPASYYGQAYASYWIPEGSRAVQAILVGFSSTVYQLMQQLRSEGRDDDADEYRTDKLADIQSRYDEIMAKIDSGEDFEQLMNDYNEDGGNGMFLITPGTEIYGTEFVECAMGLENPGDVATCVTDFGYYIVKYVDEVSVSEETLKATTESVQEYLLQNEKSKLYSAEYDKWKTEYAFETDSEVLGL
ncbi:MAG: peptidylprolyl isomerase [Oscillospiraceae bacterium]